MNKQPFYHRAVVLFTATHDMTHELESLIQKIVTKASSIISPIVVEECEAEPGDPADLL